MWRVSSSAKATNMTRCGSSLQTATTPLPSCQRNASLEVIFEIFGEIFKFLGRTQPFALYCKADGKFDIWYLDFDSLYPSINYDSAYPLGHPIATSPNCDVDWKCLDDIRDPKTGKALKGWTQVLIDPPRETFVGVSFGFFEKNQKISILVHSCPFW